MHRFFVIKEALFNSFLPSGVRSTNTLKLSSTGMRVICRCHAVITTTFLANEPERERERERERENHVEKSV